MSSAQYNAFPLVAWSRCPLSIANDALVAWGHWLEGCNRPFGKQAFGLWLDCQLVAVAISASTVNATCGGWDRHEVVELARLCADPQHRDLTRVALRLWRKTAPVQWAGEYWPVKALVSYANALRHTGGIYRFDGWQKVAEVKGGVAGGGWQRKKSFEPKSVWVYPLAPVLDEQVSPLKCPIAVSVGTKVLSVAIQRSLFDDC